MNKKPIRILLVDDHKLARQSWKMLLDLDPRFSVVHECENGYDALKSLQNLDVDIILVDINMHPLNGFEITRRILEENATRKIIGISVNNQPSYANRMLALGGKGFLTKGSSFEEVANGILEVHNGQKYICDEIRALTA